MAQFDTGLGWSANQGWLLQTAGEIASITSIVVDDTFPNQPIPKIINASESDVATGGFLLSENNTYKWMIAALQDVDVYIFKAPGSATVYFAAPAPVNCRAVRVRKSTGAINDRTFFGLGYNASYGYYITSQTFGASAWTFHIPEYSTAAEGYSHISAVNANVSKNNPGYAVACLATWYNLEGSRINSPVLISTVQEYIDMTMSGTGAAQPTVLGFRWQNTMFYMSIFAGYTGFISAAIPPADLTAAFPGPTTISVVAEAIARAANIQVTNTPDPYGGDAQPGGGEGNPDEDEEIDFSTPPTVGSYVGFFRMWNPTETELRQLASWMWSSAFDLDTFKRIFSAPIDAILGLSLVPVQPAGIGGYTIVLGGIDTQISAFTVTNRYVTLNCGSLTVDERWGAYLDYAPYTKMSIFLPYIGFRDISTDDVMGKTVELQYTVDVLSGACVAELKCGGSVLYSWQGNCAQQLPITSADWSNALSAALGLAGTAATAIVTGGGSLPLAGTVASATVNALSLKPRMERGGSISGAAGAMAGQVPYLVRERPEQAVPGRQNHFIGYPSFTTVTLGSIAGYTEVESIHLEGIPATAAELSELESILKEGFIL